MKSPCTEEMVSLQKRQRIIGGSSQDPSPSVSPRILSYDSRSRCTRGCPVCRRRSRSSYR
jgi:hypothetical protein